MYRPSQFRSKPANVHNHLLVTYWPAVWPREYAYTLSCDPVIQRLLNHPQLSIYHRHSFSGLTQSDSLLLEFERVPRFDIFVI